MVGANYPHEPGVRANSTGETADQAAAVIAPVSKSLQAMVLEMLVDGPATPEALQARLEAQLGRRVLLTSVRPRLSQLKALGKVRDSGLRGLGEGGRCKAIAWELVEEKRK